MPEPYLIAAIIATFLIAGTVKGVIGLGLPTVSLGLLAAAVDLTSAMALMLVPSFVTNVWQAMAGGEARALLRRLWPFLLMAALTVWLGALALTRVNLSVLLGLLGGLIVLYAGLSLAGLRFSVDARREKWSGACVGTINGILTGMTGAFVMPGVMYLQAIGLERDALIQAMGMLFTVSTLALGVALQGNNLLSAELGGLSLAALVPALAGMAFGQWIRKRLSAIVFRRVFFTGLLVLGGYIIAHAAVAPAGH